MSTLFWIIAIIVIICLFNEQKKKIQKLKEEYEIALKGKDKAVALNTGRAYYLALRKKYGLRRMTYGSSLKMVDEVSIMNEINAMM